MKTKGFLKLLYYQKYLGLFLIAIGLPMVFLARSSNAEFPLMIGLYTLYTAMEKIEDERSLSIKTSSMYVAFIFGYAIKLLISSLNKYGMVPFDLIEINHFVIIVLFLAVVVYYSRLYLSKS